MTYPTDISRITKKTLVARVEIETATGKHWFLLEILDAHQKRALVSALPLKSGHRPEIFLRWTNGGWAYYSECDGLPAQSLRDVAWVEDGEVIQYLGRPFAKSRPLAVDVFVEAAQ